MNYLHKFLPEWLVNQFHSSPKKTPWWIEIQTQTPRCTYYFGPFDNINEAKRNQPGYIEDLVDEKAEGLSLKINQTQPRWLTICED